MMEVEESRKKGTIVGSSSSLHATNSGQAQEEANDQLHI
jgi:hypothetical protein